jgi:hypothetical protein
LFHLFLHQDIFDQKQPVIPPPTFVLQIEDKRKKKGRHFDTDEVTEAESQAVLSTLTEYDFHDPFKK